MRRIIREAQPADMVDIMQVMDAAKKIMRQSGNMHQWREGYPSEAVITADLERNGGFVVEDDGKVVGYFAFLPSPEPTYAKIYEGDWLDDERPYHVVHRIASYPDVHGIFICIMDYCFSHDPNIVPYIIKVGQQFCEMSLYENTEELFGDFEENDYLCIRYLTY